MRIGLIKLLHTIMNLKGQTCDLLCDDHHGPGRRKGKTKVGMWGRSCSNLILSLLASHVRKSFYFYQTKLFNIYYLYNCTDQISTQFLNSQVHLGVALAWRLSYDTDRLWSYCMVKLALIYLPLAVVIFLKNKAECMHILVLSLLQRRICTQIFLQLCLIYWW